MLVTYITLIISIYILYLTIRHKYTICPVEMKNLIFEKPNQPVKVSEIFQSLFRDPAPIPGTITGFDSLRV